MKPEASLASGLKDLGLTAQDQALTKLLAYAAEMAHWNRVYNLTRVPEGEATIVQHLLDSLSVAPYVDGADVVDIGSGAGLPGVPLAIYYPDKQFTLVDSNGKKTRFLEHVRIRLKLHNTVIVQSRAESLNGQFDTVTCRALASLPEIARLVSHLLRTDGLVLAMKGALADEERDNDVTPLQIDRVIPLTVPGSDATRQLVVMKSAPGGRTQ